ncbi:ribonuclease HII [Gracilimonas mengyeensis]|uniref:Ribonuclease HII n=1 Tax=Gracilimonas mengyeensis TaxID=1302730 RepID=A0A521ER08_9BACT|nr:ribonuclease HII [Gracilimonas mengyeensis]SMO86335.1 RNase HII [Gracilimonas mengyeensis]
MAKKQETDRLHFERQLWEEQYQRVMGLDEVGRGCLAGPVVAAGVIFEPGTSIPTLRDSKTIEEKERLELAELIKEKAAYWTVQEGSIEEIDELNILWASIKTMQKCVEKADPQPDYLLVDGNRFTNSLIPYTCVIKGDDRSMTIAAASILAKVYRDELMRSFHQKYPHYGWDTNVGYPTKAHKQGLAEHGYTTLHRQSFKLGTDKKYQENSAE